MDYRALSTHDKWLYKTPFCMKLSYEEEIDPITLSSTITESYTLNLIIPYIKGNYYEYDR